MAEWIVEANSKTDILEGLFGIEQEVVRCEDCVHHKNAPKTTDVWCERIDGLLPQDWFCADGERGTDDAET